MIIEFHFETKFPDIYIGGVGLFRHWWHHIKYAYYAMMVNISEHIIESREEDGMTEKSKEYNE